MLNKIAHLSDIHITRNPSRHAEYQQVFFRTIAQLEQDAPDAIVIAGDLFHDYISASNEATLLAGKFLLGLACIAPVVITRGNHDYDRFRPQRVDSVQTCVDLLDNERVRYLNNTGFYRQDNVIWVVWHHGQALSPWNTLKESRKKGYPEGFYSDDIEGLLNEYGDLDGIRGAGYTLIDLFHDPIGGAKACNGQEFGDGAYLRTSDMKGELAFFGDIHLRQFFTRPGELKPFAAYSGSLIQQHFGEPVGGHGYLLWDLETRDVRGVEVPNDVCYYTLYVDQGTDYDELALSLPEPLAPLPLVRVYWRDNSLQQSQLNKTKLRKYLKDRYGATVTFDPHPADQFTAGARMGAPVDELDLSDALVQRQLLREYLLANGASETQCQGIEVLDDQIVERLRVAEAASGEDTGPLLGEHTGEVRLLALRIDNFQSIETLELDLEHHPGLWQIKGANETGKTNIAMSLMYLHWGNTLGTVVVKNGEIRARPEKNGDNRFINNKRDQDFCQVSADYDLGSALVRVTRRSERKWKRAKAGEAREISKVSTDYKLELLGPDRQVDQDVSVDKRRRTEQLGAAAFGSFDDFLRQSFFSADTMGGLLSLDRSVFIDTLLRDLRLDHYDRRLKVFREWRSEVGKRTARLVLDPVLEASRLLAQETQIAELLVEIAAIQLTSRETQSQLKREQTTRDRLQTEFQPMPAEAGTGDEASLRLAVHQAVAAVHGHATKEADLSQRCGELPDHYDEPRYSELKDAVDSSAGWVRTQELAIEALVNQSDAHLNSIVHLDGMLALTRQKGEAVKLRLGQELARLTAECERQDLEIAGLEASTLCPTCQQLKTPEAVKAIREEAERRRVARGAFETQGRVRSQEAHDEELNEHRGHYRMHEATKLPHVAARLGLETSQAQLRTGITERQLAYAEMGEELAGLQTRKRAVERRQELVLDGADFPHLRRTFDFALEQARAQLSAYQQAEATRVHNANIAGQISRVDERLSEKREQLTGFINRIASCEQGELPQLKRTAVTQRERLALYTEQQQREELWSIYEKSVGRDGLPMQLVRRSLGSINEQMEELLDGLCFSIYLDEELEFRMRDKRREGVDQHILQGSGMERTFASLVLRLGLRRLNHRARWNILIMDELLGKLDGEATVRYAELLRTAAGSVEHVFTIEHHGEEALRPDHLLTVSAQDGVSRYHQQLSGNTPSG